MAKSAQNALVAITTFLCGATAVAQPIGSRIDPLPGAVDRIGSDGADEAIRVMNSYARCSAKRKEKAAEEALSLPFGATEQDQAIRRLATSDCLRADGAELRFSSRLMIGGMAEHFLLQRYKGYDGASLRALTDEQIEGSALKPRNDLEDLALCIIRREPVAALALTRSTPTNSEERSAVQSLAPHLGPCVPAGMTVNFGVPMLRALVSTAMFRVLQHVAPAQRR